MDKMKKYYRDKKSGAFRFVDPGTSLRRIYFDKRPDL